MIARLISAELIRSTRAPMLWAISSAGVVFTCALSWWGFKVPSELAGEDLASYGDMTLSSFGAYALFAMILGAVLVTRDYDSCVISRLYRVASTDSSLVLVKAAVAVVWCLSSAVVMTEANTGLWLFKMWREGFEWETTHTWFLILAGNLILAAASGLCGTALGFALRSTIVTVVLQIVAVLILLPQLLRFGMVEYIHNGLAAALLFTPTDDKLAFWQACLVEVGWCAVFGAAALLMMRARSSVS